MSKNEYDVVYDSRYLFDIREYSERIFNLAKIIRSIPSVTFKDVDVHYCELLELF